ncbi:MAG TPA: hypothetical protein VG820_02800 [Fimbriimonadaceae bacterium]|nr:hypothetical protein [Fimbriimonadaceae bacterium]
MESQWQISGTPITADEADKLVELVLRQRLSGSDQIPVDTGSLTVRSLAQAIGAREEEIVMLLGDLRSSKRSVRPRPAIPIRKSMAIIATIYGGAACLALGMYLLGTLHPRTVYYGGYPSPVYYGNATTTTDVARSLRSRLPTGFGFRYRNYSHQSGRLLGEQADWAAAEKYYIDFVNRVGSSAPVSVKSDIRAQDIASELALGDTLTDRASNTPYGANMPLGEGQLIRWDPIEITVDGHTISTVIPTAKVADETLEKAIRENVRQRIAKLMKLMRVRMDVSEPTELR